jgi:DNA-binding CsgD family transcriptional regulator
MLHTGWTDLATRLRSAGSLLEIAGALIVALEPWGFVGVAVLAHAADGTPRVWAGNTQVTRGQARAYLERDHRDDHAFAVVRARHVPALAPPSTWVVPLLGCGEVIGTMRLTAPDVHLCVDELTRLGSMVSVRVAQLGLEAPLALTASNQLTPRQHEVACLVARGCTNAEIGTMLAISSDAVKKHVSRALDTLGVSNRTELAAVAGRWSALPACVLPTVLIDLGREPSTTDERRWSQR